MPSPYLTYNGVRVSFGGSTVVAPPPQTVTVRDPLNPLGLPAYTVRVKLAPGYTPSSQSGVTHTLVDATENIWDYYKNSSTFYRLFYQEGHLLEVLGANTTGVTNMTTMFFGCTSLTTVPLFDTSDVTYMDSMFNGCSSLTTVPLFDTSVVTDMSSMFYNCTSVASGALALYQQASTQTTPPTNHTNTFYNCGSNTQTGAAELARIPSSWGGTGA